MVAPNDIVRPEYKYTDDDVNRILNIRLEQECLNDVYLLAPVAETENKLIELLNEERIKNSQNPNRTLLVPYLIGYHKDGHWVGVVVRFDKKAAMKIEYFDSLNGAIPKNLTENLRTVYGNDVAVVENMNSIKQSDVSSCGPCMIENLMNAAKRDYDNKPRSDEIRQQHVEALTEWVTENVPQRNGTSAQDGTEESTNENHSQRAFEHINSVIERDPYNAIAHYNKRIANEIVNRGAAIMTKIDPNFVISVIFHVPTSSSSFSSDSSDEEADSEFKLKVEEFQERFGKNSFEYATTKRALAKVRQKSNTRIEQFKRIDPTIRKCTKIVKKSGLLNRFLTKLRDNGFKWYDERKMSHIRVSVALNRMQSVSSRKNQTLSVEVDDDVVDDDIGVQYSKFPLFWNCQWYDQNNNVAHYDDVRRYYKKLKNHDSSLAEKFLEHEGEFERNRKNIPYRELREAAKNHAKTKELVHQSRRDRPTAPIYLGIMDSDVHDFNGVFSAYSHIVQSCYRAPTVMTTGYEYPLDASYGRAYQLLGQFDRMIRAITACHIPWGTYYPEPNLCILVPNGHLTIPESFTSTKRKGNMLESAIILADIKKRRPNATCIFSEDSPLITSIPTRAKEYKAPRAKKPSSIVFSNEFIAGHASPMRDDIKTFRKVTQSNSNSYNWRNNLFINEGIKLESNRSDDEYSHSKKGKLLPVRQQVVKVLSKHYNNDDDDDDAPDEQVQNALTRALSKRINHSDVPNIVKAIDALKRYIKQFYEQNERTAEEQELLDILRGHNIDLRVVLRETILILASGPMLQLIRKANALFISILIKLDTDILRYILDHDDMIEAFMNLNVDKYALMDLLTDHFDKFEMAHGQYTVQDIMNCYKEDPLHLDFMSCEDVDDFVYVHSDDYDIVAMGLEHYDIDVDGICAQQSSETAQIHFMANVDLYFESEEGEGAVRRYNEAQMYENYFSK